jgi:hypothetical protein
MTRAILKVARLDGSLLLARKGEAIPAITATAHNNPDLAWAEQTLRPDNDQTDILPLQGEGAFGSQRAQSDLVNLTLSIEDALYLRLKYLAQNCERSIGQVLSDAVERHLLRQGVSKSLRLAVKVK